MRQGACHRLGGWRVAVPAFQRIKPDDLASAFFQAGERVGNPVRRCGVIAVGQDHNDRAVINEATAIGACKGIKAFRNL